MYRGILYQDATRLYSSVDFAGLTVPADNVFGLVLSELSIDKVMKARSNEISDVLLKRQDLCTYMETKFRIIGRYCLFIRVWILVFMTLGNVWCNVSLFCLLNCEIVDRRFRD